MQLFRQLEIQKFSNWNWKLEKIRKHPFLGYYWQIPKNDCGWLNL